MTSYPPPELPLDFYRTVLIGVGATALMDAWLLLLARLGQPSSSFALVGRWIGHMRRGRFIHASIAMAPPVKGELALGWTTHYAIGIAYAALFIPMAGGGWALQPTLAPALVFGVLTVAAPFLVMQPAMGAGFAASKTPAPRKNRLRSLANHTVFGAGLYLSAAAIERAVR
jgi:hypothetical protein